MGLICQDNLAVQAHCLRREMSVNFEATLQQLSSMSFAAIELCSFPGCAGNPWGDFGSLAEWEPERIRSALERADLDCISVHITSRELAPGNLGETIDWIKGVGGPTAVLSGLPENAESGLAAWRSAFASLNEHGRRLREKGMDFAYHTQIDLWRKVDGVLLADELFRLVDPDLCRVELDPSGALIHGTDWTSVVRSNPGRFFAMHLRDGQRPPAEVPYLPALPLGEGDVDWKSSLDAANAAAIPHYILEMEVEQDRDVFAALRTSLNFLNSIER